MGILAAQIEVEDDMYKWAELDWLIYNDSIAYADLIINGSPIAYLRNVTEDD